MEAAAHAEGRDLSGRTLEEMEQLWIQAKAQETVR